MYSARILLLLATFQGATALFPDDTIILRPIIPIVPPPRAAPVTVTFEPATNLAEVGYIDCNYGDLSCNMCAFDVEGQFRDIKAGGLNRFDKRSWNLAWGNTYGPANVKPGTIINSLSKHVQGFVRTNNDDLPFVMSHSSDSAHGGYFFVAQRDDGKVSLHNIQLSENSHPQSVAEIGQYVISVEDDEIRVFDVRKTGTSSSTNIRYRIKGLEAGGGLALTKMADGSYLFVETTGGSRTPRNTTFYRIQGSLTNPTTIKEIGMSVYSQPDQWKGNYELSENLSLITECGTGNLYTIHTTGYDPSGTKGGTVRRFLRTLYNSIKNGDGDGFWRLSKVEWNDSIPSLKSLDAFSHSQDRRNCHLRSSGTVHVNQNARMEFYCHERTIKENICPFNRIRKFFGGGCSTGDKFEFRSSTSRNGYPPGPI